LLFERLEVDLDGGEGLAHFVVQLAGHAPALGFLHLDQAPGDGL